MIKVKVTKTEYECETTDELVEVLSRVEKGNANHEPVMTFGDDGFVDSETFEKLMLEKGYRVRDKRSKRKFTIQFKVRHNKKRGRNWYNLEDINKIPKK